MRNRFRGFEGGQGGVEGGGSGGGPVVFEKEVDEFGIDALLSASKRGREDEGGPSAGREEGRIVFIILRFLQVGLLCVHLISTATCNDF